MRTDKIRVLVLVSEAWRSDTSGGNTINNFFEGMEGVEFAHIYCDDRPPENHVCEKYFCISQSEVIRHFLHHKKVGAVVKMPIFPEPDICEQDKSETKIYSNSFFSFIKKIRLPIFTTAQMFIWRYSNWKTPQLRSFILDFDPDVVYAPCYAFPFQLALTRYVKALSGCNIVTWSADDCYSLHHFNLDPFFWVNRFWTRYCLRKTYPYYDEFYSISEEEAEEMAPIVGKKIGILRKGVIVPESFTPREVNHPIRFIYAGGLYLKRYKTLIKIADTLRKLNTDGIRAELHIYSGSQISKKNYSWLNDGRSSFMHGLITPDELVKKYKGCDVAIHCESFNLKYRLTTRLSFSTKIIDCFQSGCAILAIAWDQHTGIRYLKREDAAICITNVKEIEPVVTRIVTHPEMILEYAQKAYECENRNHRLEDVQRLLLDAFIRNCKKGNENKM